MSFHISREEIAGKRGLFSYRVGKGKREGSHLEVELDEGNLSADMLIDMIVYGYEHHPEGEIGIDGSYTNPYVLMDIVRGLIRCVPHTVGDRYSR